MTVLRLTVPDLTPDSRKARDPESRQFYTIRYPHSDTLIELRSKRTIARISTAEVLLNALQSARDFVSLLCPRP